MGGQIWCSSCTWLTSFRRREFYFGQSLVLKHALGRVGDWTQSGARWSQELDRIRGWAEPGTGRSQGLKSQEWPVRDRWNQGLGGVRVWVEPRIEESGSMESETGRSRGRAEVSRGQWTGTVLGACRAGILAGKLRLKSHHVPNSRPWRTTFMIPAIFSKYRHCKLLTIF